MIWKRLEQSLYQVCWDKAIEFKKDVSKTWRSVIRVALMKLGGSAPLKEIYNEVYLIAKDLIANNKNFEAKIRQQLQLHFNNVSRGVWSV